MLFLLNAFKFAATLYVQVGRQDCKYFFRCESNWYVCFVKTYRICETVHRQLLQTVKFTLFLSLSQRLHKNCPVGPTMQNFLFLIALLVTPNVSIERLDARSKIRKKLLHSNDVARGVQAIDTQKNFFMSVLQIVGYSKLARPFALRHLW